MNLCFVSVSGVYFVNNSSNVELLYIKMSGSHLLSHAVARIVPSAVKVLTVVFGMGTGVSPSRIATGQFYHYNLSISPDNQVETQPLLFSLERR